MQCRGTSSDILVRRDVAVEAHEVFTVNQILNAPLDHRDFGPKSARKLGYDFGHELRMNELFPLPRRG